MQINNEKILFSPSDLIGFMDSSFVSHMERLVLTNPEFKKFIDPVDPLLSALQNKGYEHEENFLKSLDFSNNEICKIKKTNKEQMFSETKKAMNEGKEIIYQAYLEDERFGGIADFLKKIPGPSSLGNYHYEVWDTKLSKKMKPYFAIQLSCYSELLHEIQKKYPERFSIILGNNEKISLKLSDYYSYYTELKNNFFQFHKDWKPNNFPDPGDFSNNGKWSNYAESLLKEKRHLRLVANITKGQIRALKSKGISTIDDLAKTDKMSIPKINTFVLERLKLQAKLQIESENKDTPLYKLIKISNKEGEGLDQLPSGSADDIFFDIEGYPLIDGGLEYLWGASYYNQSKSLDFIDYWAHDQEGEKNALSSFITFAFNKWKKNPTMHIYHYGNYEIASIRRLMGRYGVCEYEVDTLLRKEVFVDLYKIIKNSILIGEPGYSIKNVEKLYRGKRKTEVKSGGESVIMYENWRSNPDGSDWKTSEILNTIREYNKEDCFSTRELTEWLRERQSELNIEYSSIISSEELEIEEKITETTLFRDQLFKTASKIKDENKIIKETLYNLAWFLEFHSREDKPSWWRYYDRQSSNEYELYDDMDCLVGLKRTQKVPFLPTPRSRNKVYEYSFDNTQPFKGSIKNDFYLLDPEQSKVTVKDFFINKGLIHLSYRSDLPDRISLIPLENVNKKEIINMLKINIENLIKNSFPNCAIIDFLFRKQPRFKSGTRENIVNNFLDNNDFLTETIKVTNDLDRSYLCIQGPPGAGKSYTAVRIIGDLLRKGKRIGISSNSHSAIINLMTGVSDYLIKNNILGDLYKQGGFKNEVIFERENVQHISRPVDCLEFFNEASSIFGGTAWFFCNSEFSSVENKVVPLDFLFIDEAGQVPVANLIAMSHIADNLILMGDQMQLSNPTQGTHPDDSGKSILEYLLGEQSTIPPDIGIFLPKTFRMHPDLCCIISEQVYDNRLLSDESTYGNILSDELINLGLTPGIHYVPVLHASNIQGSIEEVSSIKNFTEKLIGCSLWKNKNNKTHEKLDWDDILIVAPYNHQVNLLKQNLNSNARVGTVDMFQGQEAPIVILSMSVSDASESPRGWEFLFSKNRLNVAISRAQSAAIIFASPNLISTSVNTLKQMQLINFYSRIKEIGKKSTIINHID